MNNIDSILTIFSIENISKTKYKITFSNDVSLLVHKDISMDLLLYPNKNISSYEYNKILDLEQIYPIKSYVKNLLKRRSYSVKELCVKLHNVKKLEFSQARKLVREIQNEGYQIDANFMNNTLEKCYLKCYSKSKICSELKYNWLEDENIDIEQFVEENYQINFEDIYKIFENLENNFIIKNNNTIEPIDIISLDYIPALKAKIYSKLFKFGYTKNEINSLIRQYFSDNLSEIESRLNKRNISKTKIKSKECTFSEDKIEFDLDVLINDIQSYVKLHKNININNYKESLKVISVFKKKGYTYSQIKRAISYVN